MWIKLTKFFQFWHFKIRSIAIRLRFCRSPFFYLFFLINVYFICLSGKVLYRQFMSVRVLLIIFVIFKKLLSKYLKTSFIIFYSTVIFIKNMGKFCYCCSTYEHNCPCFMGNSNSISFKYLLCNIFAIRAKILQRFWRNPPKAQSRTHYPLPNTLLKI